MQDGSERLARDITILEAMASQMAEYLDSQVLFWPMSRGSMPMLTLGGYLMREHRLTRLALLLTAQQQSEANAAISLFNTALANRLVRFENKAKHELQARLRQWEEFLKDIDRGAADRASNYATAVETRTMITSLMDRLSLPPYEPDARSQQHLTLLDNRLQGMWRPGEFIWPADWTPAYPRAEYWFLYGTPPVKESSN